MNKKLAIMLLTLLSTVLFVCGCNPTPLMPPVFTGTYQDMTAFVTDEITVPTVEYTEGATLTVTVNAPDGSAVEVVDGKFTLETAGVYVITYVAAIAELTSEMQIKVTATLNTQKPEITLGASNLQTILMGEEVTIASASAKDAIGGELAVIIVVSDANGETVTLTDNKFIASVLGDYTVTYTAEDKYGNKHEIVNVINCYKLPDPIAPVPEDVANSFETEEECYLEALNNSTAAYTVERNNTDINVKGVRSGAYSLKLSAAAGGTFNLLSEVINGSQDLSEIANVSLYAYNPLETSLGFSIYKVILKDGGSVTPNIYKAIPAGEWVQYSINLMECGLTAEQLKKVYAIQLWSATALSEVYIDDISYDLRSDYPTMDEVEASIITKLNVEMQIAVPAVNEGTEISYKLTDAEGNEIAITEGKWTPTVAGVYTITYTATKKGHVATATTTITVADKPVITLVGENVIVATVGDEITVATATAKDFFNQELTVVITVTDANSEAVVLTEGKFTASVVGEYTIKYFVEDAHGNSNEITNVIECKPEPVSKGEVPEGVVNSFETEEECRIAENTANSGGHTLTHNSTNENADGVRSGAYSLHVVNSGTKNFNLVAETILGSQDLSEIGKISFWIYNPLESVQGMSLYRTVLKNGTALKTEVYIKIPAKSWCEFTYNYTANSEITKEQLSSVFSIQFWGIKEVYIDDISVVYRKDIKPAEPANTAISVESFDTNFAGTNLTINTDNEYIIDGASSFRLELKNSGKWSYAGFTRWQKGIVFTEDVNVLTFKAYASKDVKVSFHIGAGGNTGSAGYAGFSYSKGYSLKQGWNEVKINFDTDLTAKTAALKNGIVYFYAQAVKESFIGPADPNASAINDSGAVLYLDAFVATTETVEIPKDPNVVVDFETFTEIASGAASSASGGAGISLNTDATKAKSGNNSIKIVANQSCQVHFKPGGIFGFEDLSKYSAVEFYVYCDTAKAFNLMACATSSGGSISYAINTTLKAGEWNKITIDLTNEVMTTLKIWSFKFWMSGGAGIVFYVDDITLIPA